MKNTALVLFLMLAAAVFSINATAQMTRRFVPLESVAPLKGVTPLEGVPDAKASGEAQIESDGFKMRLWTLGVTTYGLRPNAIYSVWLVNEEPKPERIPAGLAAANQFKTNGSGIGRYVGPMPDFYEHNQWRWRYIAVYYHPDNNPANIKDMVLVLKGDLIYGYHS